MSDFDVESNDMYTRRLSDADAEALMAGRPVAGAPSDLVDMLSTMRRRAETGPSVVASAALREFVVDGNVSANPVAVASAGSLRERSRPRSRATRAAALLAVVPVKLLIGASMAAAAVGGAQAFGVVDLPLLPRPTSPVVTTTVPVEIVPRLVDADPATSSSTLPAQARVGGLMGCEFGHGNASRPDVTRPTVTPSIDPCTSDASADIDAPPRTPVEPAPGARVPAFVPDDDRDQPVVETPDPAVDGNSGHDGDDSRSDAPVPAPETEHDDGSGPDDAVRESPSNTNDSSNSEDGRTPDEE